MANGLTRVMAVVGTRPEVIKVAPVVRTLRAKSDRFETILCSTGQHREMLDQALADFELEPDHDLNLMAHDQTLAGLSAAALKAISELLGSTQPHVLLVQGDTTTAMVAALCSFYQRIPVGHIEAGLRTGHRYSPFPEEVNRKLVTALATWHYAPTKTAVDALRAESVPADAIVLTGNTVVDALLYISQNLAASSPPGSGRLILVTAHRRESFGKPFEDLCLALRDLVRRNPDVHIIYPVHLNPKVQEPVRRILGAENRVQLIPPVPYREMAGLLRSCYLVLTDSGGIQEEAPVFGKPVLVLREVTERPEAVEAGTVKVVGTSREGIVREAEILLNDSVAYARMSRAISPYGDGHAAERIAAHLAASLGQGDLGSRSQQLFAQTKRTESVTG